MRRLLNPRLTRAGGGLVRRNWPFPGAAEVGDQAPDEAESGVGGDDQNACQSRSASVSLAPAPDHHSQIGLGPRRWADSRP